MWWVFLHTTAAAADEFPADTSGCVTDGAPPDSDGDGVLDELELGSEWAEGDGDTDEDGCPDTQDPDDDGDGLPTFDEDYDGDGNWEDDTERIVPDGFPPAYLDEADPFDDDGDGFLDERWGGTDCEDGYFGINPDNDETWYDGRDQDCSHTSDYDQDGDGFDARDSAVRGPDCDDLDPDTFPAAVEDDGPADRDCDGYSDPHRALVPNGGCSCAHPAGAGLSALAPALWALRRARRR